MRRIKETSRLLRGFLVRAVDTGYGGMKMHRMTVQAERRFSLGQKTVGDRSMRLVTDTAVLVDRVMLKQERTFLVDMTGKTLLTAVIIDHGK